MTDNESPTRAASIDGRPTGSWRGWLLAAYWIALFTATHLPPNVPIVPGATGDKVAHLAAYAILAFLIASYWQASAGWLGREHYFWIVIGCSVFGIVDELLQIPVGRYASIADWIADTLGALLGVIAFACWRYFRHPRATYQ